jgi:uncharacterized protein (TIGR02300 family)
MARPELGTKRQCQSCGSKFYDLNKDPILCPKCGSTFQVFAPVAALARAEDDDEVVTNVAGAELVSLDDVVEGEEAKVLIGDDDIDLDDDLGDDDTFLEEEEDDNDDVIDLIDGDIDTDDET